MNLMQASNQWASRPADQRFETLTALADSVKERRLRSRSVDVDCNRTEIKSENGLLTINGTITPCEPTHWSFGQLSTLVKAPAGYLRTLPQPMVAGLLNYGLRAESNRETVKFMTIASRDGESNTLQAVTSTTYGRIWDADCVDAVGRIVERTNGRFYNPKAYTKDGVKPQGLYASDRDVFMFMIDGGSRLDAGPRAQLNRGFFCWNSEVGARTFGLMTFLFNEVCGNHIVWGAKDVNEIIIRHTSGGPYRFDSQAAPALLAYCNQSAKPLEDLVRKAQELIIGKDADQVAEFAGRHGKFSKSEIKSGIDFAKAEEGDCQTLWQFVQGLTAYARGFDFIDSRIDLETRAGKLLNVAT